MCILIQVHVCVYLPPQLLQQSAASPIICTHVRPITHLLPQLRELLPGQKAGKSVVPEQSVDEHGGEGRHLSVVDGGRGVEWSVCFVWACGWRGADHMAKPTHPYMYACMDAHMRYIQGHARVNIHMHIRKGGQHKDMPVYASYTCPYARGDGPWCGTWGGSARGTADTRCGRSRYRVCVRGP